MAGVGLEGAAIARTVGIIGWASEAAVGVGLETGVFGDSSLLLKAYGKYKALSFGIGAEFLGRLGPHAREIGEVFGEAATELGVWWKNRKDSCE